MANVIDSYSESNRDGQTNMATGASFQGSGQSFTGTGSGVGSTVWFVKKTGAPTGNATSKIYTHSGTFGTNSVPTGAALATSDNFDVSTLTTSFTLATFTFSGVNQIVLTNGTHYVVTVEYSGGDASNHVDSGNDTTSPTHSGNFSRFNGAWASGGTGTDYCFYVYDNVVPTTMQFNNYQFVKVGDGMSVSEKIR